MTIKDLAVQTGYSVGTVSRVLNHQPHVSQQAREIILRAAEESGFQLNTNAKQLKQQRGNAILVICKGNANELFDNLLVALQSRIGLIEYPLEVDYIDESDNEVRRAIQLCTEKKPLGILFLGGSQENFARDFHRIDLPCVAVTSTMASLSFPNLSSVSSDDVAAAELAIGALIQAGHRKIAIIGSNRDYSDTARLRYTGCMQAFDAAGIPFQESCYETARFTYDEGYRAARELLQRQPGFTALFAMSDVMAIGAVRALRDAGLQVPEDVSVIGFDGLAIGNYLVPRLTTVAQSVEELTEQSLELLSHSIHQGPESRHETVGVELQWRESAREIGR